MNIRVMGDACLACVCCIGRHAASCTFSEDMKQIFKCQASEQHNEPDHKSALCRCWMQHARQMSLAWPPEFPWRRWAAQHGRPQACLSMRLASLILQLRLSPAALHGSALITSCMTTKPACKLVLHLPLQQFHLIASWV